MSKRIINLGGGSYHARIEGDYVQGSSKTTPKAEKSAALDEEVINTNGANYVENLGGKVVMAM